MADRFVITRRRLRELTDLIRDRCGHELPDDDAGREYLAIVVDHMGHLVDGRNRALNFAGLWAPWMPASDLWLLFEAAAQMPRSWKAEELGRELNLSPEDRRRLRVTTIAANVPAAVRETLRLKHRAQAARDSRRRKREATGKAGSKARTGRSPRQQSILEALSKSPGWRTIADLKGLGEQVCWHDGHDRPLAYESFRRVLKREISKLVTDRVIEAETIKTKWGQDAIQVRLIVGKTSGSLRNLVPAD